MSRLWRAGFFALTLLAARGAWGLCGPDAELAEEVPDVVLSGEIRAQAAALAFDPVRIYEFVRNEFEFQAYYGLMRGPEETLRGRRGNEYDLSALLVSLLRVSEDADGNCVLSAAEDGNGNGVLDGGARARFARGRVALPHADVVAWLRVEDADAALEFLGWNDPEPWQAEPSLRVSKTETEIGRMHLWVEAEVPVARYRGSGLGGSGLAWLALDPSFKRKELQPGIDLEGLAFGIDAYLDQVRQDTPLEAFERQATGYLALEHAGASLDDVPIDGPIQKETPGVLPTALPVRLVGAVARHASLVPLHTAAPAGLSPHPAAGTSGASDYRWLLQVTLTGAAPWSISIPDVRGRSILLHAPPVSPTPFDANESVSICDAYGSDFARTIAIGSSSTVLGTPKPCGSPMEVHLAVEPPLLLPGWLSSIGADYPHPVVGGVYAVALDTGSWTPRRVRETADALIDAREQHQLEFDASRGYIETNGQAGKQPGELFYVAAFDSQKALTGGLLHLAGAHYMRQTRNAFRRTADLHHQLLQHLPWVGLIEAGPASAVILDTPFLVRPQELLIDIRGVSVSAHSQSSGERLELFTPSLVLAALEGSAREHTTWEDLTAFEAISTVKGLQVGSEQGGASDYLTLIPSHAGEVLDAAGACNGLTYATIPRCGLPGQSVNAPTNLSYADFEFNTPAFQDMTCPDISFEKYCRIKNEVVFLNAKLAGTSLPHSVTLCTSFGAGGCCNGTQSLPVNFWNSNNFYFRALAWDLLTFQSEDPPGIQYVCGTPPTTPTPAPLSLRIPKADSLQYQSFTGSVDFSYGNVVQWSPPPATVTDVFISASLAPEGSPPAGGSKPLFGLREPWNGGNLVDPATGDTHSYGESRALQGMAGVNDEYRSASNPGRFVDPHSAVYAGDPVNVFTGNYHQTDVDAAVPGRGGHALRLARSYNSRLEYDGPLGYGWIHSFDQHLRFEDHGASATDDDVVWVGESGGETTFDVLSPVQFAAPGWSHDRLVRASSSAPHEVVTKGGMTYRFHPRVGNRARLDRIIDRNGNAIVCEYADAQNPTRLTGVLDTAGRRLAFAYLGSRLRTITDWTGRVWEYTVDPAGDLAEFRNPAQVAANEAGVRFEYYNDLPGDRLDHNLRRITQPEDRGGAAGGDVSMEFVYYMNGAVQSHTDSLGQTTSFTYNLFRRRTTVTYPDQSEEHYVYDGAGNVIRHESPRGIVREYEFAPDSYDRIGETDGFGFETSASYDGDGNMLTRTDRLGQTETWTYNAFSEPLSHEDRRDKRREWSYDERGNLREERAFLNGAMRVLRRHEYDAFGNRTKTTALLEEDGSRPRTTRFSYAANGVDLIRSVDANVHEMRFEPDELSRVESVETTRSLPGTDANEALVATTQYDALSRPFLTTDTVGTARRTIFDANGNVEATLTFVPDPAVPSTLVPATVAACQALSNCRVEVRNSFDAGDRLVAQTNALGDTAATEYDLRGRPVRVTSPLGHETRFEYDADGNRTRTIDPTGAESIAIYDAENRVIETRDALGRITSTTYDREGRVLTVTGPGGSTLASMTYDAEGNPLSLENAIEVESQAEFDDLGRRTLLREAVGELDGQGQPLEAETRFAYDLEGRLVEKTDALGRKTRVHYDVLGRLSEVKSPLGHATRFAYDEVGNRTLVTTPTGEQIHFEYDARGLVTRRNSSGGDPALAIDDRYGYDGLGRMSVARAKDGTTRFFAYDALDRAVSVSDPALGTVRQVFDADGRVAQIAYPSGQSVHYGYSARGEVTSVRDPAIAGLAASLGDWQLGYDPIGRPVRERDPFGVERRTSYTTAGFVDQVRLYQGTSPTETFTYSAYDNLGNPGQIVSGEGTTEIQYDERSRVDKVAYPGGSLTACLTSCERFAYDRVGNRTTHVQNGIERRYLVDADDRLVEIEDALGATVASFTHDAAGRRTGRSDASGSLAYVYDALGRLRSYQTPTLAGSLAYTATDERTLRTEPSGARRYLGEWYETEPGNVARRLVHGPGIDNVLGQVTGATNQVRTLLRDGTANVARIALDGSVGAPRRYEAFAGLRSGSLTVERGFAGRPREGNSGLLNVRARHYDPATGRFLQPDPLGIAADQLYAYAGSDPYRFNDPTGRQPSPLSGEGGPSQGEVNPDPLGPNPGNFFTLGAGADVVLLGGFEANGGIFLGRTRSGELQGGLFVSGGPAAGVALSVDVQGQFITNVDKLDREFSINFNLGFLAANGIVSANPTPPNNGERFVGDFINAGGAGASLGPIPVEGFISFTGTRTLDVIGPVRRLFEPGGSSP